MSRYHRALGILLCISLSRISSAAAAAAAKPVLLYHRGGQSTGTDNPASVPSNSTASKMSSSKGRRWRFAAYCTGHGLGHKTRVVELCRALLARGHEVIVCSLPPNSIFTQELGSSIRIREVERPLDVGGVQLDALRCVGRRTCPAARLIVLMHHMGTWAVDPHVTWKHDGCVSAVPAYSVDVDATLERYYEDVHCRREELISSEAQWIESAGVDCVLVDSPAVACAAAKRASRYCVPRNLSPTGLWGMESCTRASPRCCLLTPSGRP